MRRPIVTLTVLALVACGPQQPTSATPTPSSTPSAASGMFVVLESRGLNSTFGGGPDAYDAHDTVAIVGVDGYAKARATFKPRALPFLGTAGTLMQPEARVAAGAVFYVDGDGTVRRLDASGKITQVATFPAGQPQQEISFAVSPDGNHLVASVLTLPAKNPNYTGPGSSGGPWVTGGYGYLELFAADGGGTAHSLVRTDLGSGDSSLAPAMRVVGWDRGGPLVTLQAGLGTQQGSLGNSFEGCCLAHLDVSGHPGPPLTAPNCYLWQESEDGSILCGDQSYNSLWLIDKSGHTIVKVPTPGQGALFLALSPDAASVAAQGRVWSLRGSPQMTLPSTFYPEGWLDDSTIIGYQDRGVGATVGNMALVRLPNPGQLVDLGFKGIFVGKF